MEIAVNGFHLLSRPGAAEEANRSMELSVLCMLSLLLPVTDQLNFAVISMWCGLFPIRDNILFEDCVFQIPFGIVTFLMTESNKISLYSIRWI